VRRALLGFLFLALAAAPGALAAAVPRGQPISVDLLPDSAAGQHATEAEPDSFAFGGTVVAAFQVGRYTTGGAAAIGWSTSADGGATWRTGLLPALTPFSSPAGPWSRVSDPAVAYDRIHGFWLVSLLALRERPGGVIGDSAILTSRSKDGITWDAPVTTVPPIGAFAHDKNWIVCDNGAVSRFAGRCYTAWTQVAPSEGPLALSTSLDGGATWGAPVVAPPSVPAGNGVSPVVRPDGVVVMPYAAFNGRLYSVVSADGGATYGAATSFGGVRPGRPTGMRAPTIPSVEVDAGGRVFVAWHAAAAAGGPTQLWLASTADGSTWSAPVTIPAGAAAADRFLPGLGVDPATSGASTRLALVYYSLGPFPCNTATCLVRAHVLYSSSAGRTWSEPVEVSPQPMPLEWIAATSEGKMLGDYFSTSFVGGGSAVPVFASALAPVAGRFNQSIYATRVPPLAAALRLSARSFAVRRHSPRLLRATLRVRRSDTAGSVAGAAVSCSATAAGKPLQVVTHRVAGDSAVCVWRLPVRKARPVRGTVTVRLGAAVLSRPFRLA
jgi:hypothetical protein